MPLPRTRPSILRLMYRPAKFQATCEARISNAYGISGSLCGCWHNTRSAKVRKARTTKCMQAAQLAMEGRKQKPTSVHATVLHAECAPSSDPLLLAASCWLNQVAHSSSRSGVARHLPVKERRNDQSIDLLGISAAVPTC